MTTKCPILTSKPRSNQHMKFYFTICLFILSMFSFGQFTDVTSQYNFILLGSTTQSGCGVSFYDYDKDGWDDLTIGQSNNDILVYNNNNGNYAVSFVFPNTGDPKQLTWIDYDNDGDADFFFAISTQSCKLFRNDGNNVFIDVTANLNLPITNGKSFGACWGDYDRDGWLDVYICNYSTGPNPHTNWLLHNNGNGTFSDVTVAMGVGNGFKPSYQSAWVDVNLDGLLDLYVVNDFSYVNELYINDGTSFIASGAAYNLNMAMEGMSNSWSDFDNDIDLDVFVSDNLNGNKLMQNNSGVMTNIASSAGVTVNSTCWGSLWMDYDHDGWDDLHVSTSNISINNNKNFLFRNNGNNTFTDVSLTNDNQIVFASAKGDKNNDGYWDFIEMKQYPSTVALYQNNGGANHWIKTGLTGTLSNRDGIGTVMTYYYGGQPHILHTFCGEGFLEQDSQYEILSLGTFTSIDSLIIKWPRGWIDRHYNLAADQFHAFVEGETFIATIENVSDHMLCPEGNSVVLIASAGTSYQWSNEQSSQSIEVYLPGIYSVTVTNESGIEALATYEVTMYSLREVLVEITQPKCNGSSDGCITLSSESGGLNSILWSNNAEDSSNCDIPADNYSVLLVDANGCSRTMTFELDDPDSLLIILNADTACFNGTVAADIVVSGGTGSYSYDWGNSDPIQLTPGQHVLNVTDQNDCAASAGVVVEEFPEINFVFAGDTLCVGEFTTLTYEVSGVVDGYVIDWNGLNPQMVTAGNYLVSISNPNGCFAVASILIIQSPEMIISSQVQNAVDGNNGAIAVSVDGGISPYTFYWDNDSIANPLNGVGQGIYNVIVTDAAGCTAFHSANVVDVSVGEFVENYFIAPNPFHDKLNIRLGSPAVIAVYDIFGKIVFTSRTSSMTHVIETSGWCSGVYIVSSSKGHLRVVKE